MCVCSLCYRARVPDGTPPLCLSKSLMIAKPQGENKSKLSRELLPSRLRWGSLRPPRAALLGCRHRPQNAHTSFFKKEKYPNIKTLTSFPLAPLWSLFRGTRSSPTAGDPQARGRGRQSHPQLSSPPQHGKPAAAAGSQTYCRVRYRSGSPSVLFPQRLPSPAVPRGSVGCWPCVAPC